MGVPSTGGRRLGDSGEPHLNHPCTELFGIVKLAADILGYLSGGFGEGVLSRDYVIDGALYLTALAFKLGFYSIPAATVLVAAPLASS
jgi:hypothetical protein